MERNLSTHRASAGSAEILEENIRTGRNRQAGRVHRDRGILHITAVVVLAFTCFIEMGGQDGSNGFLLTGSVIYEQINKLNIKLEGEAAELAHALPSESRSEKILRFDENESLYENHVAGDLEENLETEQGGAVTIKMEEPDNKVYTDLDQKKQIQQKEFMSRFFIIESELEKGRWKLTGEQKMILDYPCQEAICEKDGEVARAWFTPVIAVPSGPEDYVDLPGLVLAVDVNQGEHVINATSVNLEKIDKHLLKKPAKGKKVSSEEFRAIVKEKMEEMGLEGEDGNGNGTAVMIRIRE